MQENNFKLDFIADNSIKSISSSYINGSQCKPLDTTSLSASTPALNNTQSFKPSLQQTQLSASSSNGIDNLKSIITQINKNNVKYSDIDGNVPVRLSSDKAYIYEQHVPINISGDLMVKESRDGMSNLRTIVQEAIHLNKDLNINNSSYIKMRGIYL